MKKTILLSALVLCFVSVQAQKVEESAVPAVVKKSFQKEYPIIKDVKWEKEKGNYEANFKEGSTEESVTYDSTGTSLESEKEIAVNTLPKAALDYLAKNLPGKKIKEASQITHIYHIGIHNVITYEAEVNEVDYTFDAEGKFLKQEADED